MEDDFVIETRNLTRHYGRVEAVRGLNLRVSRHRVTGFLGRNGAGKSTTIRMLLGVTRPTEGSGTVLGRSIDDAGESREIRRHVAYVGEDKELYGYMTVEQSIRFTSSFYTDWRPEVAQLGSAAGDGTTVFFSSHQIAEVERIADRICIIDYGRVVADLSLDEMRQDYRRITLGFTTEPSEYDFEIQGVRQVQRSGRQVIVRANHNADAVIERAHSLAAVSVDVAPVSLLEVFLETVKDTR